MTKEKIEKLVNDDGFTRLIAVVCVVLGVATVISGFFIYPVSGAGPILLRILLVFVGAGAGYFLHNALHELFHALFAAIFGSTVTEICFWGVKISKFKPKISLVYSSLHAGWTVFYVKKPEKAQTALTASLAGGLAGSLLSIILCVIFAVVIQNGYTFELFVSAAFPAFYMLLINFLPFTDNDGSLIFRADKDVYVKTLAAFETESRLFAGETLEKAFPLTIERLYGKRPTTYYDCLFMLSKGDLATAKLIADKLVKNPQTPDNEVIALLVERFFIACLEKDEQKVELLLPEVEGTFDENLSSCRAHAAYRLFKGEKEWAKVIATSFYALSENCPLKGLGATERQIFDKFIEPLLN